MKKNPEKTVFILSVTSDIGRSLAEFYMKDGYSVYGTCRDVDAGKNIEKELRISVFPCDIKDKNSIKNAVDKFVSFDSPWDIFISAVGTGEPIGNFFSCDFDAWEQSVIINSSAQLRVLHSLFPYRRKEGISNVVFFAGGGTNNPFPNFSAYASSKIMLIKMCELLDDENDDLNVFILGPGWVRTKIHDEVLNDPEGSGTNYLRVKEFLSSDEPGTPMESIYNCINWCVKEGKPVAGGRNFSVVHDSWSKSGQVLAQKLQQDIDKFKLRRMGNEGPVSSITGSNQQQSEK